MDEAHANYGDVEVNRSDNLVDVGADEVERDILIDGDTRPQKKEMNKEDYETGLDGDFIKVEKEVGDVKEISHPHIEVERTTNNGVTNIKLLEAEETIKSLEVQLEMVSKALQQSESEKALLKSEVDLANEKVETIGKHCDELECDQQKMKEQNLAAEQKYNIQLESFQETLGALDVKHRELGDLKESFSGLSTELENSRKKLEELEAELASSASETRRLEELSNERSSYAELKSNRASELEKMLDLAKASAKDMEDQLGNLQEELKGLYDKVSELSEVQEKLKLSEIQLEEFEQKLAFKDDVIRELTKDLDLHKSSEEKMKEELLALENLLLSSKDDIQSKIIKLEEVELKLQQEIKTREDVEAGLKNHEAHMLDLQDELKKLTVEKEDLLSTIAELNTNLSLAKELCGELEGKFHVADGNFSKTDSLLSQALSSNAELEQKVKSLEELHSETRMVAETASQRSLELEGLIQTSNAAEEGLNEQLREKEVKLISAEQKNVELEERIASAEQKFFDAEREIKGLGDKIAELTVMLSNLEEERDLSKGQVQEYKDRISQLESSLCDSESRNSELLQKMEELEFLVKNANNQTQNLEQLLSIAEAKYGGAEAELKEHGSRVSELSQELEAFKTKSESLEFVVQAANAKEKELTDMLNEITEERKKFEELSNISSEKLLQAENVIEILRREMKSAQEKLESIEEDLKMSGIRENEVLEKLKSAEEQLEHHGRAAEQASARCLELESAHESLQKESELKFQEAVNSFTMKDLEVKQLQEKVMFLEEHLATHQGEAAEATEKVASLKAELEARAEKLADFEKMLEEFKGKVLESEMKLEQSFSENELLAGTNSQLKSELEAHQCKASELNVLLSSIHAEKESTAEQLASHVRTIEQLTTEHSRGLELHSASELRVKETEFQLHEALEKFTHRDSEARDLNEKLLALEVQLRMNEEQLGEATATAENRKVELEEALHNVQNLEKVLQEMQSKANQFESENEGLAQANMIQIQQLATYEAKMSELEMSLNAAIEDKEDILSQLYSAKKTIENLTQQLASEGEKLQSQIYSVVEENNTLNKMYQDVKEEYQHVAAQLEEEKAREISVTAEVENLRSEIGRTKLAAEEREATFASRLEEHSCILRERDFLNEKLMELQKDLTVAQESLEDKRDLESKMELERDAAIKSSLGKMEAEHQRVILLEKEVEELKQQLQLAETQHKEKIAEEVGKIDLLNAELDDSKHKLRQNVELEKVIADLQKKLEKAKSSKKGKDVSAAGTKVRSREIEFDKTTTKGSEGSHQATELTHANPPSGIMAFKFILGVALVSVVIGIILGKKY